MQRFVERVLPELRRERVDPGPTAATAVSRETA
jgi:hypothetical protein